MKTRIGLSILFILSLIAALLLGVNLGKAQEPQPNEAQAPAEELAVTANVASKISFQGVLKEGGNPVNGTRNLIFRLYSNDTCTTQVGSDITKNNVPVSNGLFAVDLEVPADQFNGQALWIQVEIGGTKMDCQEILPAPYAIGLKPGAMVRDATSEIYLNYVRKLEMPTHWRKYGLYVTSNGTFFLTTYYGVYASGTHYGIYGESDSGTAVYATSDSGTAIKATGTGVIESSANTDWVISPQKMVKRVGSSLEIDPVGEGFVILTRTSGGTSYAYLPVDIVALLFGTRVKFKELHFSYVTDTTSDQITDVSIRQTNGDGTYTELCHIDTDLSSTTWTEANCIPSSPIDIFGPLYIRFELNFAGSGSDHEIRIGKTWIRLSE